MFLERVEQLYIGRFGSLFRDPRLIHGVSTRYGGVSEIPYHSLNLGFQTTDKLEAVKENRRRFFSAIGTTESCTASAEQVHGSRVAVLEYAVAVEQTDGLITNRPGLLLTIRIADCLPVFLLDEQNLSIGLLHAGWRGSASSIVKTGVQTLSESYNSEPDRLWAFLGPSIGPCCYQVGSDVADQFEKSYVKDGFLDLWAFNTDQLLQMGLQSERIIASRLCTVCQNHWFFSHRAEKGVTGRMMAVFGITGKED